MGHLLFLLVLAAFQGPAALAAPAWCEFTPRHDSAFKNYVGRTTAPSLDEAFRDAVVQARKEAVEENFGFQFHFQSAGNLQARSDSSSQSLLTQDFEERSRLVRLEGFERVDSFSTRAPSGGVSVCVWFRYPVRAAKIERDRLAGLENQKFQAELVVQGTPADARRGVVKISSVPPGARVRIDRRDWGETPLELHGKLRQGRHQVTLDHPEFEQVEREFETFEGATARVEEVLRRAMGHVRVVTVPEGALVMVQGKLVGVSPVGPFDIPAGEGVTLVIEHPEAKRYERRIQLERNEVWEEPISLELKKARLSFTVLPNGSEVEVDQRKLSARKGHYELEVTAGSHWLRIARPGFRAIDQEVRLRGGEDRDLGKLILIAEQENANTRESPSRAPASLSYEQSGSAAAWYLGLTLVQMITSPIAAPDVGVYRFGASLEYQPFQLLGIRLAYHFGYGPSYIVDREVDFTSNTAELGFPIYVLSFRGLGVDSLFVEPEASVTQFKYSIGGSYDLGPGTSTPSQTIRSTGIELGWRVLSRPNANGKSEWGVTVTFGLDRNESVTGGFQGQLSNKFGINAVFGL